MNVPPCVLFVVLLVSASSVRADDSKDLAAMAKIRKTLHQVVLREPIDADTSVEKALEILVKCIRAQKINGHPMSVAVVLHSGESPPPEMAPLYPPVPDALKQKISVPLTKMPLDDALEFVDRLAGLKYMERADGIEIVPWWVPWPVFQMDIPIPRDFFPAYEKQDRLDHTDVARQMRQDIRGFLRVHNAFFNEEATASINSDATHLTVRGTEIQLRDIPYILQNVRPPCVFPTYGPEVPKMIAHEEKETALTRKLQRIILPEVRFADTRVIDAVQILQDLSVRYDTESPDGRRGVKIILEEDGHPVAASARTANPNENPDAEWVSRPQHEREIDYAAKNVTLFEALEAVAKRGSWAVDIGRSVVTLRGPASDRRVIMVTREYLIPPDIAAFVCAKTPGQPSLTGEDFLYTLLDFGGVLFPLGSSMRYQAKTARLTLRNSEEYQQAAYRAVERMWRQYYEAEAEKAKADQFAD